jgi:hypothetical protein
MREFRIGVRGVAIEASCEVALGCLSQLRPSIFDGETLPYFIDPFVQRIEASVQAPVVKIKYVSPCQKSENPVMAFHIDDHLLDRVTAKSNDVQQGIHRILPFRENGILVLEDWR